MVYITKSGRTLPDKIRFDPDYARRFVPQKLVEKGIVASIEEGRRAVEVVIAAAEPDQTGIQEKSE